MISHFHSVTFYVTKLHQIEILLSDPITLKGILRAGLSQNIQFSLNLDYFIYDGARSYHLNENSSYSFPKDSKLTCAWTKEVTVLHVDPSRDPIKFFFDSFYHTLPEMYDKILNDGKLQRDDYGIFVLDSSSTDSMKKQLIILSEEVFNVISSIPLLQIVRIKSNYSDITKEQILLN